MCGSDGTVRVWHVGESRLVATFTGHRKVVVVFVRPVCAPTNSRPSQPVTALAWSGDGALLATGSQSTEVLVWDVIAQHGKHRLKGHTGSITALAFVRGATQLVSGSKDTFARVWELATQACVQTLVGHRHEVWALAAHGDRVVTGSADNKLRVWIVGPAQLEYHGTVDRSTELRVQDMAYADDGRLVVLSAGKTVDVFEMHDDATRAKRVASCAFVLCLSLTHALALGQATPEA